MHYLRKGSVALSLSLGALALLVATPVMAEASPGGSGGSVRPVLLREIESQGTISVAPYVTLDFSDGGANNVNINASDNPGVVHLISKEKALSVAVGTAHVNVANFGHCPKSTGMLAVHCDPIPV